MESISSGDEMNGQGEKIFVSVRVRPLNEKEIAKNYSSDWECINNNTIICKTAVTERSKYPNAYTFDRVYGSDSTTRQVYEEGVKRVALSALNGINSSIFAYGQTSSGKTYTMTGITQYAISDIFDHINQQIDREFMLKFSAIEIYNECVRDLLSADGTPLRLLDDPEKGTVVDKLTEIHLEDWTHLMELLAVCEAQRKIGETSLNEMSSRSHQIIRLTIESTANEFSVTDSATTLTANVNFVDLAGSERASQTLAAGKRLKEGGHINRSLLTLGTVVRKLSKAPNGHIPYRDSKLTRILQNSLGGNARTAIVCTLSPAHIHLEQSRNTLLFAVCAKDVRTSAQVNVVMSEKALVKQLQREMTRLENELKSMSGSTNDTEVIIKEKEVQIQKMEQEVKDLTQERDLARARLEEILRAAGVDQNILPWIDSASWDGSSVSSHQRNGSWDESSIAGHLRNGSWDGSSVSGHLRNASWDEYSASGHQRSGSWDAHSMSDTSEVVVNAPLLPNASVNTYSFPKDHKLRNPNEDHYVFDNITPREFMNQYFGPDSTQEWEKPSQKNRRSIDSIDSFKEVEEVIEKDETDDNEGKLGNSHVDQAPSNENVTCLKPQTLTRSTSCSAIVDGDPSPSPKSEKNVVVESKSDSDIKNLTQQDSKRSTMSADEKEMQQRTDGGIFDLSPSSRTLEKVMEYDLRGRFKDCIGTPEPIESGDEMKEGENVWCALFEEQRRMIVELWNECNIPLLHRTYFFLLVKGDPSDSVYIEVELRRLSFLKQTLDDVASARALTLERAMLSRKLLSKYTSSERESLFAKWGIALESKNRRFQLAQLLWTKTDDLEHIKESADIVAKLVGFVEPSTPMELFALSVAAPKQEPQTGLFSSWRNALSLLRY
ncbi:putative plus-end-directed kinesin ATPase [Helianthus annuus]|uniref:Plus-end-directed kinesin ATPase n=1 Tax=Helianthus annuus TaxID=4232 RepID=A0A251VHB8_HELAN|nr:kinesin-like protein KIN-7C isoform X1 [Helianthus annuus]KAF5818022.1 putative plus-end-directed kinesin ATPase [Helianthus annuus]KAJ0604399.1 putative plus-end-directed kinesin ATPase [Helianthus annuus]KAJ0618431.1 putative plus-end-directed kinesin ATPase [Helianthus annuus]KAJ0776881.1 putative plus-end-directed kinesin ATPase [Helianthus annuus]KAJ0939494.1 putative plus-end-directed kinesin ATPase [Helianthus annuus]